MPNPVFPFAALQDSSRFGENPEDPAVRVDTDGGYEITRARFTRAPRRTWTTGFASLTETEKGTLATFWNTVKGGSAYFDWTNPNTLAVHVVRFTKSLSWKYVGKLANKRWDVDIEVREV